MGEPSVLSNFTNNVYPDNSVQSMLPFQPLLVCDVVLTAIEVTILSIAAYKIQGWRKNYRNYLLLQLSLVRLIKRIIYCVEYAKYYQDPRTVNLLLFWFRVYVDCVLTMLVLCFIHHMYQSLIVVIVKVTEIDMYKGLMCTWLIPLPFAVFWVDMLSLEFVSEWRAKLLICAMFRWPLMLLGIIAYLSIVRKVFCDKKMKFARMLTLTTFFICFIVNLNMFLKDLIWLFFSSSYLVISYVSELAINFLIMILYLILVILNYIKCKNKNTYIEETDLNLT